MTTANTHYRKVQGLDGLLIGQSGRLNCFALSLTSGDVCLYSPVAALAKSGSASLQPYGEVTFLLAPNHYHNKGLSSHRDLFPKAELVCSAAAKPRLNKITGLVFGTLEGLYAQLPETVEILLPEGLKTGEIWLQIRQGDTVAWVVADAFSSNSLPPGEFNTLPTMLGTFPKFGVKDGSVFSSWVADRLAKQPPTLLLPCHGSPMRNRDLGREILALLENNL